jgi:hypothetical protein
VKRAGFLSQSSRYRIYWDYRAMDHERVSRGPCYRSTTRNCTILLHVFLYLTPAWKLAADARLQVNPFHPLLSLLQARVCSVVTHFEETSLFCSVMAQVHIESQGQILFHAWLISNKKSCLFTKAMLLNNQPGLIL